MRTLLLAAAVVFGILIIGSMFFAVLKIAFGLLLYLFIGALIIGAVVLVVGKIRGALGRRG
ncbi:MAG: hypothetical protein ACRDO8_13980 [Nocardioidaceae bacterium]